MLKLNHITLENTEKTRRMGDMSFHFLDTGFISIHGNDESLILQLARLFAGLHRPCSGSMVYGEEVIEYLTSQEQCCYRSICTASLLYDLQLLEQRPVLDNIRMSYDEDGQELDNLLRQQGLHDRKETWIEDLDFNDHTRMVLLRILPRRPRVLVVYLPNSPSSIREWERIPPLLKKLSAGLPVVIVQDESSYPWSDRIIGFETGYVISGSCGQGSTYPRRPISKTQFQLQLRIIKRMRTRLHYRPCLKHLLLILLILTSLILISTAVFSTTLDVAEIEILYLKQNDLTNITIEKHATGNNGETYERKCVPIQDVDIQTLKKRLKGGVFAGYVPVDSNIAIKSLYLTSTDSYTIVEMGTVGKAGLEKIYGHYSSNIYGAVITYQTALNLFSSQYGVQPPEFYLYQTVNWYGLPLTVTGIIAEDQPNSSLSLNMGGYTGSTTGSSSLNSDSLYVYPGFHKGHNNQQQQTSVSSSKRFIDRLTLHSYEVGNLYPTPCANTYYFYDGEQLHPDSGGKNQSMVKEDGAPSDFSMVLCPGYRSRHLEGCRDDALPSWDMREADYTSFIESWTGRTIEVQVYTIDTALDDGMLMKKTVKIKGFLFPITWDYMEGYLKNEGSILMNGEAMVDCMQFNTMIQSAYFHSEKKAGMRKALQYLRQHPTYSAFFSRSHLLQFFVADLKKISFLLFVSGGTVMLLSIALLVHLLQSIMEDDRKEVSAYYMLGENMYALRRCYVQHILALVRRHTVTGCLMATLIVSVFALMIYMKLSAAVTVLLPLLLPLLVSAGYLLLLTLITHQLVERICIAEELFCDGKNGNI